MSERLRRAAPPPAAGNPRVRDYNASDEDDGALAFQLPPPKPEHTSRGIGKGIDEEEGGGIFYQIL